MIRKLIGLSSAAVLLLVTLAACSGTTIAMETATAGTAAAVYAAPPCPSTSSTQTGTASAAP